MPFPPNNLHGLKSGWRYSLSLGLLIGSLLLSNISTPLNAAEPNQTINQNQWHTTGQLRTSLTHTAQTHRVEGTLISPAGDVLTLANNTEHFLWFNTGIWITNIGVRLYIDKDQDAYFSAISLSIDADTDYSHARVYATIDIQGRTGASQRLLTTGAFSLYRHSKTDEYRVDIELIRSYTSGHYDLIINLFNADNDSPVESIGPHDFANLSRLPLEAYEPDTMPDLLPPATSVQISTPNTNIRVVEYTGASSFWTLLPLGLLVLTHRLNTQYTRADKRA